MFGSTVSCGIRSRLFSVIIGNWLWLLNFELGVLFFLFVNHELGDGVHLLDEEVWLWVFRVSHFLCIFDLVDEDVEIFNLVVDEGVVALEDW